MSTSDKVPKQSQSPRRRAVPGYKKGASDSPGGGTERGKFMRNRRTPVLGGSGFIGRYVVKRLAARGEVVPAGCRNAGAATFLRAMGDVGQGEPLNVAIDDELVLPALLAGSGAV